jgi:hypothetical protein
MTLGVGRNLSGFRYGNLPRGLASEEEVLLFPNDKNAQPASPRVSLAFFFNGFPIPRAAPIPCFLFPRIPLPHDAVLHRWAQYFCFYETAHLNP